LAFHKDAIESQSNPSWTKDAQDVFHKHASDPNCRLLTNRIGPFEQEKPYQQLLAMKRSLGSVSQPVWLAPAPTTP
ncbi:MAG TPA: hypothetical protein VJ521_15085, partial [Acidobacteriota bacterium]|nr:hypothetical protein [Acidobacteriota bacterium]